VFIRSLLIRERIIRILLGSLIRSLGESQRASEPIAASSSSSSSSSLGN